MLMGVQTLRDAAVNRLRDAGLGRDRSCASREWSGDGLQGMGCFWRLHRMARQSSV